MNRTPLEDLRVVVHEPAHARLDDDRRFELLAGLLEAGHPVARFGKGGSSAALAVLSEAAEHEGAGDGAARMDIRGKTVADVTGGVTALREERALPQPGAWTPWFPVIDYERCTNCMQCLSFCLFDVYGVDEHGKIQVRNEDNCKTNCPACSRVCPDVAILFPKYAKGPINGDKVSDADVQKESMKVDITALLGGDIYSSLRERADGARKRFSTERDESKALLERKRCLKALKKDFDVPDEVLMSLPSAGEIEDRARRAREKMERRRAASQSVKDEAVRRPPTTEEWDI